MDSGHRARRPGPNAPSKRSIRNIAYALLSGADGWMFDGEDALGQVSTMSLDNQRGIPGEVSPSLSVRFMGINHKAIASYLISLYCSLAILTEDALGVLENVSVDQYHEYK